MAASLASEPESPYQTFFSQSPGTRSISRSASSTAGRLMPETSPPKVVRSSSAIDGGPDTLVAVAESGQRPGGAEIEVGPAIDVEEPPAFPAADGERGVADLERVGDGTVASRAAIVCNGGCRIHVLPPVVAA